MTKHVHGGNIYTYKNCLDFSANCNPLGTPETVKQAVRDSLDCIKNYPQVGYAPLRSAIAEYEGVSPENVICGNGAAELVFSLCHAIKPKKALIPIPTFAEYEQALVSCGCEVEHVLLREEDGFQLQDSFINWLHRDLDVLFLCNPNNPTGVSINRDFLFRVLRVCRELDILLVVDECFLDFIEEPERFTLKAQLSRYHNLFLLKAFTKRYAMPGIRLGYGITENRELLEAMTQVTQPWNISVMAQAAGIAALKESAYVEKGRQMVFREAKYLKEELASLGMQVYPSEANYIFFRGPENLFEICAKQKVLIRDCSNYAGLRKGFYRVAVRTHEENEQLIRAIKDGTMAAAVAHAAALEEEEQA